MGQDKVSVNKEVQKRGEKVVTGHQNNKKSTRSKPNKRDNEPSKAASKGMLLMQKHVEGPTSCHRRESGENEK